MPESPVPIEEGQKASADDTPTAQRIVINWMVDTNGSLRTRPGISNAALNPGVYSRTTGTSTGIIGAYVWKNVTDALYYVVYVRADRTIWALNLQTLALQTLSSTSDTTTTLQGGASHVAWAEDSQRLIIAGGGALQQWTGVGLTSRLATYTFAVNQPPTAATHVVSIGNYLVANNATTPNLLLWSNLGDGSHSLWNPLNFNTADADPDPIVALYPSLREVLAFGSKTLQVFSLGADPNLPFATAVSLNVGCVAPYSPVQLDNAYAWLDDTRRIVVSNGRGYEVLSDDINKLLRDLGTVTDCFGFRARMAYWDLAVWVFPTEGKAFVYDLNRKQWCQWRGWNGADDYAGVRISCYAPYPQGNLHIVGDPSYENLWTLDGASFSDTGPGLPIVAERVTQRLDFETASRKRCRRVRFFVKRGQASSSATEPAYLDVAKRDDDGPWNAATRVNLGLQGDYTSFRDWYPGGIYRRRQYRIRFSGGVDVSIHKAVEMWTPMGEFAE